MLREKKSQLIELLGQIPKLLSFGCDTDCILATQHNSILRNHISPRWIPLKFQPLCGDAVAACVLNLCGWLSIACCGVLDASIHGRGSESIGASSD